MKQELFVKTKKRPWKARWQKFLTLFAGRDHDVHLTSWTDDFTGIGSRLESLLPKQVDDSSQTQAAAYHDVVGLDVGIDRRLITALKRMPIQGGPLHGMAPP